MPTEMSLRPRLTGPRFEEHGIPLEMFKDFAALEEMIVEVAKYVYLEDHPNRRRTPRGFTEGVSLKLKAVEKGSAIPVITVESAPGKQMTLFQPGYFERAVEAIIHTIDAASRKETITAHLPERFLGYFDRIGRSLLKDEAIEFPIPNSDKAAKLTQQTRKNLILASRTQEITDDVQLRCSVPEIDQDAGTFHIQLVDGTKIKAPLQEQYYETVLQAVHTYRDNTRVLVEGVGRFRRDGKLVGIDSIEHVTSLDPLDVPARLNELRMLRDGWLDGQGKALDEQELDWFAEILSRLYPEELPLPYVYPTIEGNIRLEWAYDTREISMEVDLHVHRGEWDVLDVSTGEEEHRVLNLTNDMEWRFISERIREYTSGKGTTA